MAGEQPSVLDRLNRDFGDYVTELVAGRTNREIARLTGVNHATVGEMRAGVVPSYRLLERFGNGLGLTPHQWHTLFKKARYVMEGTPAERLLDWLNDYNRRYGKAIELHFRDGVQSLTHEDVDRLIEHHEERARRLGWGAPADLVENHGGT